ncbi:hypothetical protein ACFLZ7_04115 [Nanoarchaeota archaeon]
MNTKDYVGSFDLGRLVSSLNFTLVGREGTLSLGSFKDITPGDIPLAYRVHGIDISIRGEYPLIQTAYLGLMDTFAGNVSSRNIGSIIVETGKIVDMVGGKHESVKLTITEPLELQKGGHIPPCRVKIYQDIEEMTPTNTERKDEVKRFGYFGWKKANLVEEIPSEWFTGIKDPYELKRAQAQKEWV